jgi:hypothetical protein
LGQNLLALSTSDGVRSLTLSPSTYRLAKHGIRHSHKFSCNKRCEQNQIPTQLQTLKLNVTSSAATLLFPLQGLESAPLHASPPQFLQQDAITQVMR